MSASTKHTGVTHPAVRKQGNSESILIDTHPLRSTGFSSRLTQEDVTLYLASTASSLCIQGLIATQPGTTAAHTTRRLLEISRSATPESTSPVPESNSDSWGHIPAQLQRLPCLVLTPSHNLPTFPAAPRHPALAPALQHLPAASTSRKVL